LVDADTDADTDTDSDADSDADPLAGRVVEAELIHSSEDGRTTPPTWNAHLPKLAADGRFLYAVHTEAADSVADRAATILRREVDGGAWESQAIVSYAHQPPSIVMDADGYLHMVFSCLQDSGNWTTCFQGGAGSGANTNRFYHLVFGVTDSDGGFDFTSYWNYDEFTANTNGYLGLGTTSDGVTWWSVNDTSWTRYVQYWASGADHGTLTTLSWVDHYLLYPIHGSHPELGSDSLALFAGVFDPEGGTNAGYPASALYAGDLAGLSMAATWEPDSAVSPGSVGAYPSAVAYGVDGTLYLLGYRVQDSGDCTELLRFDDGVDSAPVALSAGCLEPYAKLRVASDGTLYLLASAGGGESFTLGASTDEGESWAWADVAIEGLPDTDDITFFGATPLEHWHAPAAYDADRWLFLFSGYDANGLARHSYLGQLELSGADPGTE